MFKNCIKREKKIYFCGPKNEETKNGKYKNAVTQTQKISESRSNRYSKNKEKKKMKKYLRRRRKKWLTFNFLVVGPATYFIFFEQYGKMCFVIFRERKKKCPGPKVE